MSKQKRAKKLINALPSTGSGFSRVDDDAKLPRFRKELLRVGEWKHPATGKTVRIDKERLNRLAKNTKAFIEAGNPVPFPDGHTLSAKANLGELIDIEFDGERLLGVIEVADKECIEQEKIGTTIKHVSVYVEPNVVNPATGDVYEEAITHVAATPEPVVGRQENFIKLARGEEVVSVLPFVRVEPKGGGYEMSVVAFSRALGMPDDASEADVLARVVKLRDEAKAERAKREAAEGKAEALSAKIEKLEQELKARLDAEIEAFIEDVKRRSAEAGSPISEERLSRIRKWFEEGQHDAARELGEAYVELALARGGSTETDVRKIENPAKKDPDIEKRRQIAFARREMLRAAGCEVEMNDDGTEIVKVTVNGEEVRI